MLWRALWVARFSTVIAVYIDTSVESVAPKATLSSFNKFSVSKIFTCELLMKIKLYYYNNVLFFGFV